MLRTPSVCLFNALFSAELLVIWGLGSVGVFLSGLKDTLLPSVISGGVFWILLQMTYWYNKYHSSQFYWTGLLQLIACWSIFPLFKAIRIYFYSWSADDFLFMLDTHIWFNKSLPQRVLAIQTPWFSELVSFCYFGFYFLIIVSALFFFFKRQLALTEKYFFGLMLMYFFGFIGYFSLPAAGPYIAFPALFPYPVYNGVMTLFLTKMVDKGITGMDVFPSLHSGITLYIVGFLFRAGYRRSAYFLTPMALCLIVATVYLHYHYGVDIIVGTLLAFIVLYFTFKKKKVKNGTDLQSQ